MPTRFLAAAILIFMIIGGYILLRNARSPVPPSTETSSIMSASPTTMPTDLPSNQNRYYYPVTTYTKRITNRWYGKSIVPSDSKAVPCGAPFSGLHVGDDLEVTSAELHKDVPVYSIADGTIRQARTVSGYGGLLVIQYTLNGQPVTAYYGHVNLARTTVQPGDSVTAGQQLTVLGNACSTQTGGERKHLHFALHSNTTIDVKGYVTSLAALSAWVNPKETLAALHAQEPS